MTDNHRTFVVVSHTHWDREWYQPFEEFRARLVRMMDSLLDLLERDPEYRHFVLDGQTVPLDDYLEIRPERREQIEGLVQEGRLLAGPNYMLPDEFLIGGEAWIRNLMFGIRSARAYGRAMMVGYSPDAFGHIAHLPAILRGFGIDSAYVSRGTNEATVGGQFRWRAPDGSEVFAYRFGPAWGYGDFTFRVRSPFDTEAEFDRTKLAEKTRRYHSPLNELTQREGDDLREMAEGKNNAAIAEGLRLSERTVEKVIHAIFLKLGLAWETTVHKRVKAVIFYLSGTAAETRPADTSS
jgi:alpha-mannosidase